MMTDDNPQQNQDPQPNFQTPDDGINWENPPKKRKCPRVTSFIICFLTAAGIITYGFLEKTVIEYEPNNDNSTIKLAKIKTGTITCYTTKEKTTYPVFFNLGLGLMGIILGTFVDRFSLVIEELFQFKSRYNRDIRKLFKSCFSGINLPAVAAVCLIVGVACTIGRETGFQLVDLVYIGGGIGVGPFVIHLLNLNTGSEVDVSIILEEREMYPAHTLAWSYYFNHLKPEVQKFNRAILKLQIEHSSSAPSINETKKLSQNKLLLLLPPSTDLTNIKILTSYDRHITELNEDDGRNPYPFPVYNFTGYEKECFAMLCVKEPIMALRNMKFPTDYNTYEDEIKRFYKTLCEIIEKPPNDFCAMMGLVVPITVKTGDKEKLKNGGLTRIIMDKVNAQSASNDRENKSCCCCFCCCCSRKEVRGRKNRDEGSRKKKRGRKNRDEESKHMIPRDDGSDSPDNEQATPATLPEPTVHDEIGAHTSGDVVSSLA